MTSVHIAGIGMTRLGKFPDRSVKDLTREAVGLALADAGARLADIEAAWFANTRQGLMEGQNGIRGQCALRSLGFERIPIVNVENACAGASTALREAFAHIKAGLCEVALVIGAEKMFFPENREGMFRAFIGGADIHAIDATRAWLAALEPPDPGGSVQGQVDRHSFFMDVYAALARLHMREFGVTVEDYAIAAAKNHHHSTMNPLSQYRIDMTPAQVLGDVLVSWPLTRAMCSPISDGAAAAVICASEALPRLGAGRSVRVASVALASGSDRDVRDFDRHIGREAAVAAYDAAGFGPEDIDVAEVHDACSFAEIVQIENLGFCRRGEGGRITRAGDTRLGGRFPVNVSGGLVSKGHPVGATGLIQLHELVTQLRGEAGQRQVEGARRAIAENGGGFLGVEEAATAVTILERAA